MSPVKQKILLLLLAGVALGLSHSFGRQKRVYKEFARAWKSIDEQKLKDEIRQLYQSKLIERRQNADGSLTFMLTEKGKVKALTFHFGQMKLKKKEWDRKWRLVVFDIPEKFRAGRDALRIKLRELGFYRLQKSALVFPYDCEKEMEFLIEYFGMRRFVRFCIVERIDNELHLKKIFHLT